MDRNTLLAIVLITIIILFLPSYYKWTGSKQPVQKQPVPVQTDTVKMTKVPVQKETPPAKEIAREDIPKDTTIQAEKEFFIEIESPLIKTKISNKGGGGFVYWYLNKYDTWLKTPVKIVDQKLKNGFRTSFLSIDGPKIDFSDLKFYPEIENDRTINLKPDEEFHVSYTLDINGSKISKELTFYGNRYSVDIQISITNSDELMLTNEYQIGWENGLPSNEKNVKEDYSYSDAYASMGGETEDYTIDSDEKQEELSLNGQSEWIAVRTKYFVAAMIPEDPADVTGVTFGGRGIKYEDIVQRRYNVFLNIAAPSHMIRSAYQLYMGPLDHTVLSEYKTGIEDLIMNRGWYERLFRWFSLFILWLFKRFQTFIPNYGIIIIIFSILVKIVVYPLTKKSYKSMREMSKVQPLMTELREKYKGDPQRLNREMMKLYKEHNINPLGGCVPMLLQMPLLIALFIVFRSTIQLRGASFIPGWINDLSMPDTLALLPFSLPLYGNQFNLLPILMAATMIFQSKMTMKDPKQKAMVYMMPVFMLLIFNQFPSGLNLYYTLFNIWTIIQQKFIERGSKEEKVEVKSQAGKGKNKK
jgi:YidC/Oxa1 family membrane protein insertase